MVDGVSFSNVSYSSGSTIEDFKTQLVTLGIPYDIVQQGPDAVKTYADENGILLPTPPAPPSDSNKSAFNSTEKTGAVNKGEPPEGFKQKLLALGIPEDVIAEGRDAVMQYAQENNIELPAPPEPPVGVDMDSVVQS